MQELNLRRNPRECSRAASLLITRRPVYRWSKLIPIKTRIIGLYRHCLANAAYAETAINVYEQIQGISDVAAQGLVR